MGGPPASKRRRLSPPEIDDHDATNSFYQNASQWDLEAAYAQRVKKKGKDKKSDRLPIKTQEGRIEQAKQEIPQIENTAAKEEDDSQDSGLDSMLDEDDVREEPVEPTKPTKEQILEAQEDLARMAGMLSEDPEEHITQLKNIAKIGASPIDTIKKLAMATHVAVFKDIIPGYRIRPLSDEDLKAKLSKDVKRLRTFEQTLVSCYRDFVTGLGRLIKSSSRNSSPNKASLASTAVACVCTLLDAVPHFNFRSELLNIITAKLSSRTIDKDYTRCREALETLFEHDEEGNTSLEAVTLVTKMMKSKDYNIHESLLNSFLHLRLLSEYSFRASTNSIDKSDPNEDPSTSASASKLKGKKHREFRTKRARKQMREQRSVEQEMREADAAVSHEERDKNQSEMLKQVFVAYFRILKARKPALMGAVLEGLARYAHLINQDFFGDILESLRDLVASQTLAQQQQEEFPADSPAAEQDTPHRPTRDLTRESLLCIVTAFSLLQGQDVHRSATSLNLDLTFFTQTLYGTVLPLSLDASVETLASSASQTKVRGRVNAQTPALLLMRSLSALLLPPQSARAVSPTLVAAFLKRLLTASLSLPEKSATALLALVREVVRVHGDKVQPLFRTEERRGDGVFDPEREEVESARPFAATVWELELLRLHYAPAVRDGVKGIEDVVKKSRRD